MKIPIKLTKNKLLIAIFIVFILILVLLRSVTITNRTLNWADWTGFGSDTTTSKSTEIKINENSKVTTTEYLQSGKTLWDWLNALVVPASLASLGYLLQLHQQRREAFEKEISEQQIKIEKEAAEQQARREKEIADTNLREEALQVYFDRLSNILLDKKMTARDDSDSMREVALNVIRARTLSILRRLDGDGLRKGSVIRFLVDIEVVSKFKLDLSSANLAGADLFDVNLEKTNLCSADLRGADLSRANLSSANLALANLEEANLVETFLEYADLTGAKLSKANLTRAVMHHVNLTAADLSNANLTKVNLDNAVLNTAKLKDAKLNHALLHHAQLFSTNLTNANLHRASFFQTQGLTASQIKSARYWEKALLDRKFRQQLITVDTSESEIQEKDE